MPGLLPKYIFITPQGEITGSGLVLKTEPPYIIGEVFKFRDQIIMTDSMRGKLAWSQVFPYSIAVGYFGRLDGNKINVSGNSWEEEMNAEMCLMCEWYKEEKIGEKNKKFYKRYL